MMAAPRMVFSTVSLCHESRQARHETIVRTWVSGQVQQNFHCILPHWWTKSHKLSQAREANGHARQGWTVRRYNTSAIIHAYMSGSMHMSHNSDNKLGGRAGKSIRNLEKALSLASNRSLCAESNFWTQTSYCGF